MIHSRAIDDLDFLILITKRETYNIIYFFFFLTIKYYNLLTRSTVRATLSVSVRNNNYFNLIHL